MIPLPPRTRTPSGLGGALNGQGGNHSNNMVNEEGSHPTDPEVIFSDNEVDLEPAEWTVNAMRVTVNQSVTLDTNPYYSDTEDDIAPRRAKSKETDKEKDPEPTAEGELRGSRVSSHRILWGSGRQGGLSISC